MQQQRISREKGCRGNLIDWAGFPSLSYLLNTKQQIYGVQFSFSFSALPHDFFSLFPCVRWVTNVRSNLSESVSARFIAQKSAQLWAAQKRDHWGVRTVRFRWFVAVCMDAVQVQLTVQ